MAERLPVPIDAAGWSGEGEFTQKVVERLQLVEQLAGIKVEDAPSTRSDADYNFISNEIFVTFDVTLREEAARRFGIIPACDASTAHHTQTEIARALRRLAHRHPTRPARV